ncbi:MAG: NAD-dependent epimerase/dehydratase family protein [Desulfobacteraceae bacterium]|nr:NAD-dependent epimerase/dehydratase family protein [Desulfobacteraceae bacterium]
MSKKGILLLGGGGFLGNSIAKGLSSDDFSVHIITPHAVSKIASNVIIHQGSMDNKKILGKVLPYCKTVIHLASSTNPGNSARHPALEAEHNITPSLNFMETLQICEAFHLIFVSSGGTVYGNPSTIPVNEDYPLCPISYYGAGKIALEIFFRALARPPQKNVTIVRPSNLYGPGQSLRQGFGVIRTMLEHVRCGTTMEIWGDGETIRDFLYIQDMVNAIKLLINLPTDNGVYNTGTGIGYSLNQVRTTIEKACNKKLKVKYRTERRTDVKCVVLDSSRFIRKTGWRPETSIEDGVLHTWQWIRNK